jgi:uncharacterized protein (TIGR01244 family)
MLKKLTCATAVISVLFAFFAFAQQPKSEKLTRVEQALKDDVPRLLCVNENIATAGQPKDAAFARLAANGFRAVLNLRTAAEEIDLKREQELIEKAGMKYIGIPFASGAPSPEVVDAFIKAAKDESNHPMLIHCGSANRVSALFMIYRVLDQGWTGEKALEEAVQIGLTSPALKKYAQDYIAAHKQKGK